MQTSILPPDKFKELPTEKSILIDSDDLRKRLALSQNQELTKLVENYIESLEVFIQSCRGDVQKLLGKEFLSLQEDIVLGLAPGIDSADSERSELLFYEMPRLIAGQVVKADINAELKEMFLRVLCTERIKQWTGYLRNQKQEQDNKVEASQRSIQRDQTSIANMFSRFDIDNTLNLDRRNDEYARFVASCSQTTTPEGYIIQTFYQKSPYDLKDESVMQEQISVLSKMRSDVRNIEKNINKEREKKEAAEKRSNEYQKIIDEIESAVSRDDIDNSMLALLKAPFIEVANGLLNKVGFETSLAKKGANEALDGIEKKLISILPQDLQERSDELRAGLEQFLKQQTESEATPSQERENPLQISNALQEFIARSFSEQEGEGLKMDKYIKNTLQTSRKNYQNKAADCRRLERFKQQLEELRSSFDVSQIPKYLETISGIAKGLGYKNLAYNLDEIFIETELEKLHSKVQFVLKEEQSGSNTTDQAQFFPPAQKEAFWQNGYFQIFAVIALLSALGVSSYFLKQPAVPPSAVPASQPATPAPLADIPAGPGRPLTAPENKEDLNLLSVRFLLEYAIDHPNADGIRIKLEPYYEKSLNNFDVSAEMRLEPNQISSSPDGGGIRLVTKNTIIDFYPASFPGLKAAFDLKHPNVTLDPEKYTLGAILTLPSDQSSRVPDNQSPIKFEEPESSETELKNNDAFARFLLNYSQKYRTQSQYAQVGSYTGIVDINTPIDIEGEIKKGAYQIKYTKAGIITFTSADTSLVIVFPKLDHLSTEYKNADSKLKNKAAQQFLDAASKYTKK